MITAGQRGDSPQFESVLEAIWVPRLGVGRPRKRPDRVRADKAYDSRSHCAYLRRRGIEATVPVPTDRVRKRLERESRGGRPPTAPSSSRLLWRWCGRPSGVVPSPLDPWLSSRPRASSASR
ncbi:transposase [Streptomyces sp. AN091965]|nr:transposase [Streptomyces sp. AN091965]